MTPLEREAPLPWRPPLPVETKQRSLVSIQWFRVCAAYPPDSPRIPCAQHLSTSIHLEN